ncbi:hypothetical protein ACVNS2_18765 [Paenibacillus caseinilyticus]|uniref:YhfM-like domain-containing protein n=1 Tax=Paenibacillus mucilaginosus K02 TaxID=997761 RepID=I0BJZ7_9BACL|nr:hypothetical protein [Paenibacillus mucilaginosus]AFH62694.1 hypothetical protein B2K_18540 [Paenibacillus mucilaginosus K02]
MSKLMMLVLLFVLFCGLVGCTEKGSEEKITSIKLTSTDVWERAEKKPAFKEKTFDSPDDIEIFQGAIKQATEVEEIIDYLSLFHMKVTFEDGTEKKYILNIVDEDGQKGLLVDTATSEQSYIIPESINEALRKMIFTK